MRRLSLITTTVLPAIHLSPKPRLRVFTMARAVQGVMHRCWVPSSMRFRYLFRKPMLMAWRPSMSLPGSTRSITSSSLISW